MGQRDIIHIADGGGWHLVHEGRKIGPYSSEAEAVSVARKWAELAKRQGYDIEVVVDDSQTSSQPRRPTG
jgi:hypothetical protein